ncbi:MAG: hypothetical protein HZA54_08405 [Planctomycetes bacterium]|nr:hypothetical protein [Planctomycetota bacterium]
MELAPRRHGRLRAVVMGTLFGLTLACAFVASLDANDTKEVKAKRESVWKAFTGEDGEWTKLGKPAPGDWLARFPEEGETFEEYVEEMKDGRPTPTSRIVFVPLGDFAKDHAELMKLMQEYSEVFFAIKTEVAPARALPPKAFAKSRGQYNGDKILNLLAKERPEDAIAYVAFTDQDLYSPGLNFVFGEGSEEDRVGVWSISRLGDPPELLARRTLQLMNHEVGHIFGIDHCIFYECSMDGSNSLEEGDRHPIHFCPLDEKKLAWFFGFETPAHYRKLSAFYKTHGLAGEAPFLDRVLERVGK